MKAITIEQPGAIDVLRICEIDVPSPADNEVLVRNRFAGVNYGDVIRRQRGVPNYPAILGFEACGEICELGKNVTGELAVGDQVAYLTTEGSQAEWTAVPAHRCVKRPIDLSAKLLASSMCVGLTALHLLHLANLKPGMRVLVHGGASGVGSAILQLGKRCGATFYATASTPRKLQVCRDLSAEDAFSNRRGNIADQIQRLTNSEGVDIVFDCVGADAAQTNLASLRKYGGQWFYYGSVSGHPSVSGQDLLHRGLRIQGFVIFQSIDAVYGGAEQDGDNSASLRASKSELVAALLDRRFAPEVEIRPATEIREVHELIEAGRNTRRFVLDMEALE